MLFQLIVSRLQTSLFYKATGVYLSMFFFSRQVVMILSHLEGSESFAVSHHLSHRWGQAGSDLGNWAPGKSHVPPLSPEINGLHAPRPITL